MTVTDPTDLGGGASPDALTATSAAPDLRMELPGPNAAAIIARDEKVTSPSLTRLYPLVVNRGRGLVIEDVDGNRFLDFNAGIAVVAAGHAHPDVNAAIHAQVDDVLHYCSSDFYLPAYADICEKLAAIAPISDAEGRSSPIPAPRPSRPRSSWPATTPAARTSSPSSARSTAVRSAASRSPRASRAQRSGFGITVPGSYHAPYFDPYDEDALTGADYIEEVLFKKLTDANDVAAIFVEPLQGEGGYIVPPVGWLAKLRDLCDRHGILLVMDEVQSGIGRTGTMWACQHPDIAGEGVEPDIMTIGKGLASGLPLAGIVAKSAIMDWEPGGHGSTFGGNPVACAAALATIELVENGLADNAAKVGSHLLSALVDLQNEQPLITQVRGRGLMIGLDLPDHDTAENLQEALFRRGLLTLTCGERTMRLAPPLVVTIEQADIAVEILRDALKHLSQNR